jgi:hypothetical protein
MAKTDTSQNITAVNFKEQSVDLSAPGAGFDELYRKSDGWYERIATGAATLLHVGPFPADGRLTLTSGIPVTTSDVTGAGTIYYTPYNGNRLALYDGTRWKLYAFTERSIALSGHTLNVPVDVFAYDNAGTLTLELLNWTNGTTRATALTTQDGVYVKTGATTRRYLGTFCPTAAATTEDSTNRRFVWNNHNRISRAMKCVDTADSWTYTTATWRQADNNTTVGVGRVECVIGLSEDTLLAVASAVCTNTAGSEPAASGVGIDSLTVNSAQIMGGATPVANNYGIFHAHCLTTLAVGYHYVQRLEICFATGTTSWYGDNTLSYWQTGMIILGLF